ncbi:auxin-responsive protein SAUR27-like [Nymphaea colorata]|uniref:Uncharacterized protein n=1 Tax=Nymphaea colorata TaxID=210225 RepID=A0A5K0X0I3_9MAGN|nr:auxin-responsive protein SAUR27-like [Nymphaea colorata]
MIKTKWSKGFHLGRKLVRLWRCLKRSRPFSYYHRLHPPQEDDEEIHQRLWTGGSGHGRVRRRVLLHRKGKGGEVGGGRGRGDVPKGHLAVYVGVKDPEHRFLVPIIYINHPFFRRLLKVTEEEYGFDQKGGITIPCGVSDFESVKRSIAEEDGRHHRARKETVIHRLFHIHPF